MPIRLRPAARLLLALVLLAACADGEPPPQSRDAAAPPPVADVPGERAVREVVERFGRRLARVSLLAPDSVAARAVREAYGGLVTAELLDAWTADPSRAPGREVSSPWPERIDVRAVRRLEPGRFRVEGEVVHVTSAERAEGGAAAREPVVLTVRETGDGWRVAAYRTSPGREARETRDSVAVDSTPADPVPADARAAAAVVRAYYEAIDAREYRRAYALWEGGGRASGQGFDEFAGGFARTEEVRVEVGAPGRVEGAAGSRYVRVPVEVHAVTTDGEEQAFAGEYTLRRSVVPGASAEARRWRLHSAAIAASSSGR